VAFDDVAPVLLDDEAIWLRQLEETTAPSLGAAEIGSSPPERSLAAGETRVLVSLGPRRVARQRVYVTAGPPREITDAVIVPIRWDPVQLEKFLPALEADLELARLDENYSRLGVSGRYHAPFARLGSGLDRAGMHRVAEATLRKFLQDVEESVLACR